MDAQTKIPSRQIQDYKGLTRSVAQNHARVEEKKPKHKSANALEGFLNSKWILWLIHYVKSRFGPRHPFQTYEGKSDNGIYKLDSNLDKFSIALAADWGTDTQESKQVGLAISRHKPEYTIHLGDTYYVGAPFEIENNFTPNNSFWHYGSIGSFALTGNHEMYSNGNPYFDILLKWMGIYSPNQIQQKASYFCLENDYWRIIGLDTGYRSVGIPFLEIFFSKANLRSEVLRWLKNDVKIKNDKRGLIFLTHHQYISSFDQEFPLAALQLQELIGKERKVLWFWGHEHRFALYGKYSSEKGITAYGRCIGHGGMPASIFEKNVNKLKQRNLVVYDNRIREQIGKTNVGHNGYAVLGFESENLIIDYYDEKQHLIQERWRYNKSIAQIEGIEIINYEPSLSQRQDISKAIQ